MVIKDIQKIILSIFAILFMVVALTSCGDINFSSSGDQGSVSHDGTDMTLDFPVPRFLAESSPVIDSLQAQATIDEGTPHHLDVDPNTNQISGIITGVPSGTYNLTITYFVSSLGDDVILCKYSTQVTVNPGQTTSVMILPEDLDRNIDDDNDGYTNLAEVRIGTDPLDEYDVPAGESPLIVDNFEYPLTYPNLLENGWYRLQGSGSMLLQQEDPNDPNSNHYLKTIVTNTPTNNSQLDCIFCKWLILDDIEYDNEYPIISFSIKDMNLYYFDVFLSSKDDDGTEKDFHISYKPEDPPGEWSISGRQYFIYNIGSEYIDPSGTQIKTVERNMEEDLFIATGFHYQYLKAILIRGDIDYLDNIIVGGAVP